MIPVALYKYLNCAVNKTANTGNTTNIKYSIKYGIITLMMILLVSSWYKFLKTDICYLS